MAAGGQVRVGAGQRAAEGERVEYRPAWRGPDAGPDAAAAEPRELGHLRRDERGAPVRGQRPGGSGAARAAGRAGDRRDRRYGAGKGRRGHCGVKRQYLGCAGRWPTGSRPCTCPTCGKGRARADRARQWIPREHLADPVKSLLMGLPLDLAVPHQGPAGHRHQQGCRRRRHPAGLLLRGRGVRQLHPAARALRSRRPGVRAAGAVELHPHPGRGHEDDLRAGRQALLRHERRWEVRSAGSGSKGERWYAWAWIATASARATTCSSAATSGPGSWPFTTAWCPKASC